ncbi:predicted protein [Postia placenta Mad-698-R]|nr:predicted protein [Postia placenta Mad-698-R]
MLTNTLIRRSSAQVAQDEQQKAAARRQAQQTRQEAIKKIAHLQNQSQKKDTDEQTARTLPPQLAHKSVSDDLQPNQTVAVTAVGLLPAAKRKAEDDNRTTKPDTKRMKPVHPAGVISGWTARKSDTDGDENPINSYISDNEEEGQYIEESSDRVTSQGVVQIAQANADDAIRTEAAQTIPHVDKPTEKKARPTLEDLPAGCSQKRWKTVFVPTWLEFIGGLPNPYDLQDINIVNVLQALFDDVFVDVQYSISVHDAVYKLAMQKVYDWCSMINKGTISALIKYWEDEQLTDATARAEYVKKALTGPTPPFLYRRIKYDADGLLIHPIIAETLASHIQVTEEAINGCDKYCRGALVLALVAAERAHSLAKSGNIVKTNADRFNENAWAPRIVFYGKSIEELDNDAWDAILTKAEMVVRKRGLVFGVDPDSDSAILGNPAELASVLYSDVESDEDITA